MTARLLIVEPDLHGRAMMERALSAAGFLVEALASMRDAGARFDAGRFDLAIVDELAGGGAMLEELRWVRREHPTLAVIATGALLSRRALQEMLRLRVLDAIPKPFTPAELRDAVSGALAERGESRGEALEYSAALEAARRALASGAWEQARAPLARAQAASPLDADVMALWGLVAELDGDDDAAGRAYRASLALRQGEDTPPPNPHEGLARLDAYRGATPVAALGPERAGAPLWLVTDPAVELRAEPPGPGPHVVVISLGVVPEGSGAVFFREGPGQLAFALLSGSLRADSIAVGLARAGRGGLVVAALTRSRVDLPAIERLRAGLVLHADEGARRAV